MPVYYRPCIDLHDGKVKQIIGATLDTNEWGSNDCSIKNTHNSSASTTICNFVSAKPASYYAKLFKEDGLAGGHVIMLGQSQCNIDAVIEAVSAYPKGLHVGGGLGLHNVCRWLEYGAEKVILTSYLFEDDLKFSEERLRRICELIGRQQIVVDLSCSSNDREPNQVGTSNDAEDNEWVVCLNGWKTKSNCSLNTSLLQLVDSYASEILVHSVEKEGLCTGINNMLVAYLGAQEGLRCRIVYAGGVNNIKCFELIERLSLNGLLDVTVGSALDIYGGVGVNYSDCLRWNRRFNNLN